MNESVPNPLTPEQAADVIHYFHDGANQVAREHGWRDKVSLGHAAIQTTSQEHTILPGGSPMLTFREMGAGLNYITDQAEQPAQPAAEESKSDAYYNKLDELVDKRGISYSQARRQLDEEGYE